MEWPKGKHPKKPSIGLWKFDHHKYNAIVMSDKTQKKWKELMKAEKRWEETKNKWGTLA
jgi:hypothetical protein